MKELSLEHKNAIRDALSAYCDNYLSRNRAAESLNGVSAATVSTIVNSKYANISDDMFIRIATQIGFSFDCWEIPESIAFKEISFMMTDAQMYKNVTWIVGDAGCGKTTAAIDYRKKHRNVFYILCSEDMKKSDFVREISKQVGAPTDGTNLRDMLEYVQIQQDAARPRQRADVLEHRLDVAGAAGSAVELVQSHAAVLCDDAGHCGLACPRVAQEYIGKTVALVGIYRELAYFLVRSIIKQLTGIVCQFTFQTILVIHGIVRIIHPKIKSESGRIAGKNIVQTAVLQLVIVAVLEISVV